MKSDALDYVLIISCPDQKGIVYRVSEFLFQRDCNILDSAQYGDEETGLFFLRIHFECGSDTSLQGITADFSSLAKSMGMTWNLHGARAKSKAIVLVSRQGHCLNDLLFRTASGQIPVDIAGVISNHRDHEALVNHHQIPFFYLPVTSLSRQEQEQRILDIAKKTQVEFLVLARYMQILSKSFCDQFNGQIINIHHSFLPSFKGAKPYDQAHARGVKVIGATAHYVTEDLDEGPIIEQDTERVDHGTSKEDLVLIGADIECRVLARAVRWQAEHRILLNGKKTVVFR